ncbi:MAG: hypothetical protein JWN01_909 [Patescibacteria group bacterium]|nr:hypothetical protein [Patescibacteria group bacterium]
MIRHIWTVITQKSSIDQETNNLTLGEVLEELQVGFTGEVKDLTEAVVIPMNFEVVSMFTQTASKKAQGGTVQINILDPHKKELGNTEQRIEIPANSRRLRSRIRATGFPFTKVGDYTFEIRFKADVDEDFQLVANIPVGVTLKKIAPPAK